MQIGNTKIGFSQLSKPAPLWWRRLERAYIVALAPAIAAVLTGWGFTSIISTRSLLILTIVTSVVKALGMFLGNGTVYADDHEENQSNF